MISLTPIKHGFFFKSSKYIYSSHIEQYKLLLQLDLEIVEKKIIMRLKFKARKVEVNTGNNALSEINWKQKLQEKTQKTMQSIQRKNAEKSR